MISDGRIGRFNEKGTGLDIRSVLKTPFYAFLRALHSRNATNILNLAFLSENRYLLMFSVSQGHNHSCKHDGYAFYSLVLHVVTYI